MGAFILMQINFDRHLDSLVRELNIICIGLCCLLLLEKLQSLKVKINMSKKVTSFKLMIYFTMCLETNRSHYIAHLRQIIIICSLDFIVANLNDLYPIFLMVICSSLLGTYNSEWTYRAICNWSLYQDLIFLMVE